jgi:hypothetical protein
MTEFLLTDNVIHRIQGIQAIYNKFREQCVEKGYEDAHTVAYDLTVVYLEQTRKNTIAMTKVNTDGN